VHRRLRETSFVVSDEGVAKLLDHGCNSVPPEDQDPRLNLFRPPEFLTGEAADAVCGDVWSLGVLLVIMATGGSFLHPCQPVCLEHCPWVLL
jgi:serine/threonine protein kinase